MSTMLPPTASGIRTARPSSKPSSSGNICVMALAEPVVVGTRFIPAPRVRRISFFPGHAVSSTVCVLVARCTALKTSELVFSAFSCSLARRSAWFQYAFERVPLR